MPRSRSSAISKTSLAQSAVPIQVRIGIATGLVVVGDLIRTGASPEALLVGETPNLAARLQGVAEPNTVVVSASTRRRLGRVFDLKPAGTFSLKGFTDAVACWEVVGETMVESRFAAAHDTSLPDPVGRESELLLLMRRWQFACDREGQLVLLSGQAGIGKSRLAETLCARIAAEPHMRVLCQCSPALHQQPVLSRAADDRARRAHPAVDPPATKLRKLRALLRAGWGHTRMAPLLANLLLISEDLPADLARLDPVMRKQQMLTMLAEALTELSRRRPVLLLLEDGHWIDPSTDDSFRQVAKSPARQRHLHAGQPAARRRRHLERLRRRHAPAAFRPGPPLGDAAGRGDRRWHCHRADADESQSSRNATACPCSSRS